MVKASVRAGADRVRTGAGAGMGAAGIGGPGSVPNKCA